MKNTHGGDYERLRGEFDAAFANWALQLRRLHSMQETGSDTASLAIQRHKARLAQEAYRQRRDLLADFLMSPAQPQREDASRYHLAASAS
ncbi:MAG: hypothetical protein FJW20_05400 [Acidimicrobiia bacterium]|nr:hypothetical protein [Acidimicrobiia bacterium]